MASCWFCWFGDQSQHIILCKVNALSESDRMMDAKAKNGENRKSTFRLQPDDDIEINGIAECRNNFSSQHIHSIWAPSSRRLHHPVTISTMPTSTWFFSLFAFFLSLTSFVRSFVVSTIFSFFFISFCECVRWILPSVGANETESDSMCCWNILAAHSHTHTQRIQHPVVVICTNKISALLCSAACHKLLLQERAQN